MRTQVQGVLEDEREAEERKNNIVIHDLPEPITDNANQVKSAEFLEIQNIFTICGEEITENDVVAIERRGTKPVKTGDRATLLVVKLRDATKKRHLLHNLQKFRDYQSNL